MCSVRDPLVYRAELLLSRVSRSPSKEVAALVKAINALLPVCESSIREGRRTVLHSGDASFAVRRSLLTAELADVLMTPSEIDIVTASDCGGVREDADLELRAVAVKHSEFRHLAAMFCAEVQAVCATMVEALTKRWPENAVLGMARELRKVAALFFESEGLAVA